MLIEEDMNVSNPTGFIHSSFLHYF